MLAKVTSGATVGLDSVPVTVEVDISERGLPSFTIVGLPIDEKTHPPPEELGLLVGKF